MPSAVAIASDEALAGTLMYFESEMEPTIELVRQVGQYSDEPPLVTSGTDDEAKLLRLPAEARISIPISECEIECQFERPRPIRPESAGGRRDSVGQL